MTQESQFSISYFANVRENCVSEVVITDFDQFADFLNQASQIDYSAKEDAPLFASCEFEDGRRRKANVLASGLVVLDVDDGAEIKDAESIMSELGLAGFIYTTASHRDDHHKFRIGLPLAANVDAPTYTTVWHGMNYIFGDISDPSKKGAESLFYFPGTYQGRRGQFIQTDGEIPPAEEWIDVALKDGNRTLQKPLKSKVSESRTSVDCYRRATRKYREAGELSIHNARIVPSRAVDTYLDTTQNWHHARYGFMCAVAGRARKNGISLGPTEILAVFNELDLIDGGHFQSASDQRAMMKDAENAIKNVG